MKLGLASVLGIASIASGVAALITLLTGALFFSRRGRWGRINDAASVVQMLLTVPVMIAVLFLEVPQGVHVAALVFAVGACGVVTAFVLQALVLLDAAKFEQTFVRVLSAGVAIGAWLMLANGTLLAVPGFNPVLGWLGVLAGLDHLLPLMVYRLLGQDHPLFSVASMAALFGYAAWATWLGGLLVSRVLTL